MKVLVIGATGLTGAIAVRRLLSRGDEVTAMVRDLGAAAARLPPTTRLVQGEARDAGSLARAVAGQDAVLSAFGPRSIRRDDVQEVFMRNLVGAMRGAGVRRLVNLSAWGAGDSYGALTPVGRLVLRAFMRDFFADKNRGEAALFASGLDYVNVRPSRLCNAPARGGVRASLRAGELRWWPLMTREDLATIMADQLRDDTWLGRSPLVGY